jgi:hypothetical protein
MAKQYTEAFIWAAIISAAVVGFAALVTVLASQGDKSDTCPYKVGEIVSHKLTGSPHLVLDVFHSWGDCWVKTRHSSGLTHKYDAREFGPHIPRKPLFEGF